MSVKIMIIDGQAEFRSLLMHHVTTHWPDAILSAYDPTTAGYLPAEFSGAGNDLIMLGDALGERNGLDVLRQFALVRNFPPVVYFGAAAQRDAALEARASAFVVRGEIAHDELIAHVSGLLEREMRVVASTRSLFIGDEDAGGRPLIRGYRLVRELELSEHSAVYLAERESLEQRVVLKVLRQIPDAGDSGAFDRFLQEYELIAEIDHPNIVKIYDLGVGDTHAHIVMEYLDGGDLKSRIGAGLSRASAVEYFRQITSAIAGIHEVGILHRDLKPGNIMLRGDDSIALIDFGFARRMRLEMATTGSGEIFGTPHYMSPEQGHGSAMDARSDIYSLGVIFYEMLTGEKPYSADSAMGIIFKHAKAPVPRLPAQLGCHQALIDRMLAKRPEERPQTAGEVLACL